MDPTSTEFKVALLVALRAQVSADLEAVTESQQKTQAGATHAESKSESDKDTRATESSYLARGLAKRVGELRNAGDTYAGIARRVGLTQVRVGQIIKRDRARARWAARRQRIMDGREP